MGLFDTIVKYFKADDWNFQQLEGKTILRMGFQAESGSWQCVAQAIEDDQRFMFYSILQTNVPADKRQAIAEFITRANYGLRIGNFEMDFSDGEVRYKTSIDVEGGKLSEKMWKNMVYLNLLMMDKYLPGIMSVVYAGSSPEQAITEVEG
jgi:hypothetical protein